MSLRVLLSGSHRHRFTIPVLGSDKVAKEVLNQSDSREGPQNAFGKLVTCVVNAGRWLCVHCESRHQFQDQVWAFSRRWRFQAAWPA